MGKVICWGELLIRMSPMLHRQWIEEAVMPVYIGGAELNVARALALWALPVGYVTALPQHYLSQEIVDDLIAKNIDTTGIVWGGERIGTYYLPQGADLKNSSVVYDRAHSSFATLQPNTINWHEVLKGCTWFHFSAISPAVSAQAAAVCKEALQAAKAMGLTVSVDLNYRAKLWQYGQQPVEVMPMLVPYCDVVMGNMWAAQQLLGIASPIESSAGQSTEALLAAATESMQQLHRQYPAATTIAYTFRLADSYWAALRQGTEITASMPRPLAKVVDKAGSGDCFMAGLIYGLRHRQPAQHIVDFAAAAAVGKLAEKGDVTRQTVSDILITM